MPLNEVYAFLGLDELGEEGFSVVTLQRENAPPLVVQLVAPNREIADRYREWAEVAAKTTGKRIRLVRFSNPEEVEVIG